MLDTGTAQKEVGRFGKLQNETETTEEKENKRKINVLGKITNMFCKFNYKVYLLEKQISEVNIEMYS